MNEFMVGPNVNLFPDENIAPTQKLLFKSQQLLLQSVDVVKEYSWERTPNAEEALNWINLAQGRIKIQNIDDLLHQLNCILIFMRITPVKKQGRSEWEQLIADLKNLIAEHKPKSTAKSSAPKINPHKPSGIATMLRSSQSEFTVSIIAYNLTEGCFLLRIDEAREISHGIETFGKMTISG